MVLIKLPSVVIAIVFCFQNDTWLPGDVAYIQGLLISGIGHYEHLLFKLQTDYKLNFQGVIDFPLNVCDLGLPKGELFLFLFTSKQNNSF